MNKAFKVIWNHATQSWTAVSEIARAKGKTKSVKTAKTALAVAVATAGLASASSAMAATTVEAAVAGGTPVTSTGQLLYAATPIGTNPAFGDSVLIGKNANLTDTAGGSVVLGTEASAGAISAVIGSKAVSMGQQDVVIGSGAQQLNTSAESYSTVIGRGAINTATGSQVVAIGYLAETSASYATAIGGSSIASNSGATAIGFNSTASGGSSLALGHDSNATQSNALALGVRTCATAGSATAIGSQAKSFKDHAVAIGSQSEANATEGSVAVGWSAGVADGATSGLALGGAAKVNGVRGVAIGRSVTTNGTYSVGVGTGTTVRGEGSSTVGYSNVIGSTSSDVSAFGSKNLIGATAIFAATGLTRSATIADAAAVTNSKVVGNNNYISSSNTYVLGSGVGVKDDGISFMDTVENSVYLGNDSTITSSTATIDAATAGTVKNLNTNGDAGATSTAGSKGTVTEANVSGLVYGDFAGATSVGAVSVGASGSERRIVNMAAGEISATSTDAINGSQLYATNEVLGNFYKSTVDALGGKVSPDTPNTANFTLSYNLTSNDPSNSTPDQVEYTSIGDALTALSQAVNQPLTFTANTNADTGANGTQQELGSSIAIIGSKTNKALTENTDAAVDSTYSAKNIQTVVTDNQVQIQMAENPVFTTTTVGGSKVNDVLTNPITIGTTVQNINGVDTPVNAINNLTTVIQPPVGATETTAKPTTGLTNAATLGDVLNAGWNLKENGTAKDVVTPYDTVNFVNGNGTTVTVTPSNNGASNEIKVDINLADPNLTTTVGDNKLTDDTAGKDGKIDTPATADGSKLVNATTVVNAINASGWNVYQDDATDANKKDTVNPGNNVVFKAGTNTTVSVDSDGTTTNVAYDIDLSKINDALDKTDLNVSTAPTATNNQTPTGKVETPAAGDATKLVNAGDIVEAINNSGFTLKSSATAEGTKDAASTGDELINPGDVIEMVAGKNMTVKQAANGTITYSTEDSVEFNNVNVTSKLPVTSINVGEKDAKTATDLLDLTTAAKNTPNAVVTAKDLANYGWVVATPDNGYDAAVKNANTVNFIGDNHISVTGANNATTGAYDVKIELADTGAIKFEKDETNPQPSNTGAVTATNPDGTTSTGFVSAKTVADAINGSGWRTNSTTATGQATETLVNPGEQVNFEAGNNMQVTQNVTQVDGKDVITYTYGIKQDVTFNSTTIGGTPNYTNAAGDTLTPVKDADGNITGYTDPAGNPVDPKDVITKVENPITIGTTPEGNNVITNITGNLTPTTSGDTLIGKDGNVETVTEPTRSVQAPTAEEAKAMNNNVATVGDVLNAGWNLKVNNEDVDFVKPYDTVEFINGAGTTARVGIKDGALSQITFDVNVDDTTTKITYKDASGNVLTKTDGPNGPVYTDKDGNVVDAADVISQVSAIVPTFNSSTLTTVVNETTGVPEVNVKTGETAVNNQSAKAEVTYKDPQGNTVTPVKDDAGNITGYKNADGSDYTGNPADITGGNSLATVGDIIDTINNVGWFTNSTNAAGNTIGSAANTKISAGQAVNFEAGKNITVNQEVKNGNVTYTYAMKADVNFNTVEVGGDAVYKDAAGNTLVQVGDKFYDKAAYDAAPVTADGNKDLSNVAEKAADPVQSDVPVKLNADKGVATTHTNIDGTVVNNPAPTALSVKDALGNDSQITGVASSLNTKDVTTNPDGNTTTPVAGSTLLDLTDAPDNVAVTSGDIKNLGWIVSAAGNEYTDTVKNANEVKFIGQDGIKVTGETDADGVRNITVALDAGTVSGNGTTGAATGSGSFVTGGNVADAINKSGWTTTPTTVIDKDGNKVADPQPVVINPGDAVNYVNGNGTVANVTITQGADGKDTMAVSFDVDKGVITPNTDGSVTGPVPAALTDKLKAAEQALAALPADAPTADKAKAQADVDAAKAAINASPEANKVATAQNVADAINQSGWNLAAKGTEGSELINPSDTVTFDAGNNLEVVRDGATITYKTKDNVAYNSTTSTTLNIGGGEGNPNNTRLTTIAGTSLASDGKTAVAADNNPTTGAGTGYALSVGGNQITHVANGAISPSSTDAINGSQLYNIQANNDKRFGDVYNRIDDLDDGRKAGAASAMAAAGLPQAYREGQSGFVAAVGQYEGETGVAVGFTSISDNGKWLFRGSYATNSQNENAGNLGIGYFW